MPVQSSYKLKTWRGFCFKCGKEVGGIFKPAAWHCPTCLHLYCERCAKDRVGLFFKRPVCPECRIELHGRGN